MADAFPGGTDLQQARELAKQARMALHEHNKGWLHDADSSQLDFTLCVAITGGSTDDGEKLWGIVVGGSSSAKSEDIRMVFGVADARLSDLTAAGVISWAGTGRNMQPTGLLGRLPSPAFVVIEDLAPILSDTADRQNRSKLISILRRVYDGEVQRDLGGSPGQLAWHGRVTMLAASTKVIDQQSALIDEAGPRWLLYRGKESSALTRLAGTGRRVDAAERSAARRVQEQQARALAVRMIGEVDLAAYSDPFTALEFVGAYSFAFAERLAKVVASIPDDQLRYQGKLGEQLRGEVTAMQRALADCGRVATDTLKLDLDARKARISERRQGMLERALTAALESTGLDVEAQDRARRVLARELKQIQ